MNLTNTKKQKWASFKHHFIIWIIWQGINSLGLIQVWHEVPKLPMLYNYLSLVILFYPVYYCAKGYWHTVAYVDAVGLDKRSRFVYFFARWQVLLIMFFILTYIVGSWFVDRYIFNIIYDNFPLYCNGRWTRASTYVFVAIGYSYYQYKLAKHKMKMEAANLKIIILKDYIAQKHIEHQVTIHELIQQVDEYTGRKRKG